MRQFSRREILFINLVLILSGLVLMALRLSVFFSPLQVLLDGLGIGLITTGGVNFLDRFFQEKERPHEIRLITQQRFDAEPHIYDSKYRAKKVDIFSVSTMEVLREFVLDSDDRIIERLFSHRLRLRLVFVHPDAEFLVQRASEDRISVEELRNRQISSIKLAVQFYKKLSAEYNSRSKKVSKISKMGSLEILLINACPYMSVYRVDNKIYWGLYGSHKSGMESPLLLSEKNDATGLFDFLKEHYYSHLNNKSGLEDCHLIKMILKDKEPYLNRQLAEQLLGVEEVNKLLE